MYTYGSTGWTATEVIVMEEGTLNALQSPKEKQQTKTGAKSQSEKSAGT